MPTNVNIFPGVNKLPLVGFFLTTKRAEEWHVAILLYADGQKKGLYLFAQGLFFSDVIMLFSLCFCSIRDIECSLSHF